jgi:serine/threonine protein kinase
MSRALGRYELLRPLARGGMGEVYLARRRAAGVEKWLVVKRMRPERAGDSRFLELFMREARLTMSLTHQNIVPVFDFGRIDDQVFLAMERVEGKDLGSSLTKANLVAPATPGLPPLLAAFVASECLQALDYAHRRKSPDGAELGIVHRDVTPRNVLLSWAGEVKLTDFGIAVLAGDAASKATGTPAYMAPEQARGESLDVRADVYAVGLILREALTGVRARRGSEKETVLDLAQRGELEPWPATPVVDPRLRTIADRATAIDKQARYADARSMLEDLDRYIVAERAAKQGDPPSRQLAAWLDEIWKGSREDEDNIDAKIDADVLVSFLDDGALDVIGTGTQRSALATAADESESEPAAAPLVPDAPVVADSAPIPRRTVQRAETEKVTPMPPPRPATAATPSPRRLWLLAVLGLVALAIPIWLLARPSDKPRANVTAPLDAAQVAVALDAAVVEVAAIDAAVEVDAAVASAVIDAGIEKRPTHAGRPRATPDASVGAGESVTAPAAGTKVKVTINSKPTWSNWTVDGGAPHSGVETIELAPGKHTIHFSGNPYFKADKTVTIDVPERESFTHVETLEQLP